MEQLTTEQAIAFHDSGAWKHLTFFQRAAWQLEQNKLCMPHSEFHKACEEALRRPVFTHEFGLNRKGLLAELEGKAPKPTFADVLALIPAETLFVVVVGEAP